jgi:hypothetical protein
MAPEIQLIVIGDADLTERRLLKRHRNDGILNLLRHPVLQHRFLAADLGQGQFAALRIERIAAWFCAGEVWVRGCGCCYCCCCAGEDFVRCGVQVLVLCRCGSVRIEFAIAE